jgi:hypothetical protein
MANTQTVGADKALSLTQLNQWISENEQILGPVLEIENGGVATAVVFNLAKPRPQDKFARVSLKVGAQCIVPGGHLLVCSGHAYVSGALQAVCVTRAA